MLFRLSRNTLNLKKIAFISGIILTLIVCRIPNRRFLFTGLWNQISKSSSIPQGTSEKIRFRYDPVILPLQPSDIRKSLHDFHPNHNSPAWVPPVAHRITFVFFILISVFALFFWKPFFSFSTATRAPPAN